MKTKIFNFNLVLLTALFMGLFMFISCNKVDDVDEKKIENKEISNLNSFVSIPEDVLEINGKVKVGLIFSAQWYDLNLPKHESVEGLMMVKKAISEGTPLRFSCYENKTTEISKISSAGDEGKDYLKRFKTNETNEKSIKTTEARAPLTSVIPNTNTLLNLVEEINKFDCAMPSNSRKPICIPFNFSTDGCAARAHKMAQIINGKGYSCKKIFVYGNLLSKSNKNSCCSEWRYHVAVTVKYRNNDNTVVDVVIDPSIYPAPLPVTLFRVSLMNPLCATTSTGFPDIRRSVIANSNVYYRHEDGSTIYYDNSYGCTNCTLNLYKDLKGCGPLSLPLDISAIDCFHRYATRG
jgi:Glutaminase